MEIIATLEVSGLQVSAALHAELLFADCQLNYTDYSNAAIQSLIS